MISEGAVAGAATHLLTERLDVRLKARRLLVHRADLAVQRVTSEVRRAFRRGGARDRALELAV
jgi:hypothetical protein